MAEETPAGSRALLMLPNWLGDCIMAWPVIDALKCSGMKVLLAARRNLLPLFDSVDTGCELMEAPPGGLSGVLAGRAFSRAIMATAPDVAVLLPNTYSSALHVWLAGIPLRAGVAFRPLRSLFLTLAVTRERYLSLPHQAERYLTVLEPLGLGTGDGETPEITVDIKPRPGLAAPRPGLDLPEKYAVIAPEAAYGPAKEWPAERFAGVIEGLARRGLPAVITGKGAAAEKYSRMLSLPGAIDRMGKTDLAGLVSIIAAAALFIGNDSGAAHLAAGLGVPTVAIFGSTDPVATRPLGRRTRVLYAHVECSPCFGRTCRHSTYQCLNSISVESVLEAAGDLLGH
ncbi:MAG: lipopolysaccharide heptosyltransferase II [Planctomycetes bacterium]|nr:lipopolysaccharide heptosyltransferase II [Planctomycetota bacterium]